MLPPAPCFFDGTPLPSQEPESPLLCPGNDMRWYQTPVGFWLKLGQFSTNFSPTPARDLETDEQKQEAEVSSE